MLQVVRRAVATGAAVLLVVAGTAAAPTPGQTAARRRRAQPDAPVGAAAAHRPISSCCGVSRPKPTGSGARRAPATCRSRRSPTAAGSAISRFPPSSSSRCRPAGRRAHPALVWVHENIRGHLYEHYIPYIREATAKGYVVIAPEYRGSIGYGEKLYDAIDYGGAEVDDVVSAVAALTSG